MVNLVTSVRTGVDLIFLAVIAYMIFPLMGSAIFSPFLHFCYCGIDLRDGLSGLSQL